MKVLTLKFPIKWPSHVTCSESRPNKVTHKLRPFDLLLRAPLLNECPKIIRYLRKTFERKERSKCTHRTILNIL